MVVQMRLTNVSPYCFAQSNRHLLQPCIIVYLWGSTPDPMPKADIKTKKYYGIYMIILTEGNLPNPSVSGELQASRSPWLKIPRQIFTLQNTLKHHANHDSLPLIANGDNPPSYSDNDVIILVSSVVGTATLI